MKIEVHLAPELIISKISYFWTYFMT